MTHALPFRQFVLKVHSRCDLSCDHCYVYEHADQSWRGKPKTISPELAARTASRIAQHAAAHKLPEVHVVLHGGEPLLLGIERTRTVLARLREHIEPVTRLDLRIHTNGVLLDEDFCALFAEYRVRVGISLDGDRAANDRHRRFANGRTSHPQVLRALDLLRRAQFAHLYAGILCTIDVQNDPIAVYEALAAQQPPRIDLLLPHATWDHPPARPSGSPTQYAEWLNAIYDRWAADGRPFAVRTFDSVLAALRGEPSQTESLGLTPADLLVIETDGSLEQADSLKTAFDGAPATGLDVTRHTFDEAAVHEGIEARQHGLAGLCATCQACPVVEACGGGLYAHRFRTGGGFDNPSAYCDDLKATILHIQSSRTAMDGPAHTISMGEFGALALGHGSATTVGRLAGVQDSIRKNRLGTVLAAARTHDSLTAAGELLVELDSSSPQSVGALLAHPYTKVWAMRCLRALHAGESHSMDIEHLNSIAVAAAFHAGVDAELTVPVLNDAVRLPTLGALEARGQARAVVRVEGPQLKIKSGSNTYRVRIDDPATDPAWQPLRRLSSRRFDVRLDDVDAYRDCHRWPAADRLSEIEAKSWQELFADAIDLIESQWPDYLPGLRAGLTTLMPLDAPSAGDVSAAARDAFGAIGLALPADPATLALLLLHEFQHVKLGAILDMFELYDSSDTAEKYYAPWRPDPRPFEGLFQGTYAHIAVTDFWRVRRRATTRDEADRADAQFARWRRHTAEAIDVLRNSKALTPLGEHFVAGMAQTVLPWLDEPVGAAAENAARRSAELHRAEYEARMRASR